MPFITIRVVREVIAADPAGKKESIARAVKDAIRKETGVGEGEVWVVFEEIAARDWYVGGTNVETMRSKT
jgi:4-oxalocrotonate tautomerase